MCSWREISIREPEDSRHIDRLTEPKMPRPMNWAISRDHVDCQESCLIRGLFKVGGYMKCWHTVNVFERASVGPSFVEASSWIGSVLMVDDVVMKS